MAVTQEAILRIKDMIISGELAPGQRLPAEKDLSDRLGLSRNSLREAVKGLELIKVLDVRQGDGTYVTSLEPRLLLEAMSFVADLHQDKSIVEILEVRRVLEPHAAWRAAKSITTEQIAELRGMIEAVDDTTPLEELVAHDIEFHSVISHAGNNEYLASLLDGMSSATVRARVWRGITEDNAVARTLQEHRAIVDALEARDAEMSRSWASVHVGGVEAWLQRVV